MVALCKLGCRDSFGVYNREQDQGHRERKVSPLRHRPFFHLAQHVVFIIQPGVGVRSGHPEHVSIKIKYLETVGETPGVSLSLSKFNFLQKLKTELLGGKKGKNTCQEHF